MKKSLFSLFLAASFLISSQHALAQNDKKIAISVIDFFLPTTAAILEKKKENSDDNPYRKTTSKAEDIRLRMEKMQGFVSGHFGGDARFTLIDRSALNIVSKERELQKSEEFLDGYVVGQGKNIGADYLLSGDFDLNGIALTITLFSVADQTVVGKEVIDMKKAFFNFAGNFRDPIVEGTRRLAGRVFPVTMTVVEITDSKKTKAKTLLIAGGMNRGLKNGMQLDVKIRDEREIDGQKQTYFKTIGNGEVEKVEDENFSIFAIDEGGEEIKTLIDAGKKVFCTFKN